MNIIHCITNEVTKNDVANIILAVGASPIMAHHIDEVDEVQAFSKALLLNLGATYDYETMLKAARIANNQGHAIVLDPVGVSGISFRRKFLKDLLNQIKVTCIRGNKAEIWAIIKDEKTGEGLDCENGKLIPADSELLQKMREYSSEHNNIILVASGELDLVTDGRNAACLQGGDPMMKRVTGMGCMSSGILAACLSKVNDTLEEGFYAVRNAVEKIGKAGERAAETTRNLNGGTASFHMYFIDEVSKDIW